jgi:hypothetical protein
MTKKLTLYPIVCCECGAYLGAYVGSPGEPTVGPIVLRFCSTDCNSSPSNFDEEERRETARQKAIALRLAC